MNLNSNFQYPFLKYLSEEFAGVFYQNELTCLNRMLILYHNRHSFSVDNNTRSYLDDCENHLQKPVNYWYLANSKRQRINLIRRRMWYLLKNNRLIFQQLLAREDYSSSKAAEQTVQKIYHWLTTLPQEIDPKPEIDLNHWMLDFKSEFHHLLEESEQPETEKVSKKQAHLHFHQILTGKNESEKRAKFRRLIDILLKEQWIAGTENGDAYLFKNNNTGGRLRIAALYYTLDKLGHIETRLNAPQIARLFNSWLSHNITPDSFVKAFQSEQLDSFNCGPNHNRYKHVQDCKLLIRDL